MANMVEGTTAKIFTSTERTKLSGIAINANNYTHPSTHPPSIIAQDASNRFVTDTEKSTWNGKARAPVVISASLTAAGWSSQQQAISDAAIYSATSPGDLKISQSATDAEWTAWMAARPRIVAQAIGSITVRVTGVVPSINIPVVIEVR